MSVSGLADGSSADDYVDQSDEGIVAPRPFFGADQQFFLDPRVRQALVRSTTHREPACKDSTLGLMACPQPNLVSRFRVFVEL